MGQYIENEIPYVCTNPSCPNYKTWERVSIGEIQEDDDKQDYIKCWYCHERVYLDK